MSDKFTEREKSFEKIFARDEELQFKVQARSNKYIAEFVSQKLNMNEDEKKTSYGILPYRQWQGDVQFLMGEPPQKTYWTAFKGGMDADDRSEHDTAIREFEEESSFVFDGDMDHTKILTGATPNKNLKIWLVEMPHIDPADFDVDAVLKIDSDDPEWHGQPEIVNVAWLSSADASARADEYQRPMISQALKMIAGSEDIRKKNNT